MTSSRDELDQARRETEFGRASLEAVEELKREIGYIPTDYLRMVSEYGAVGAAKRLILGDPTSYGFQRLYKSDRLDRSVEAAALLPWFRPLFTEEELDEARRRLEAHGFDVDAYLERMERRWPGWDLEDEAPQERGRRPLDEPEFRRWRANAIDALAGARAQRDAGVHQWAAFNCEQAAQLALKALLHGIGVAPWGHDLLTLVTKAREAQIEVPQAIESALRRLDRYYIQTRYPDSYPSGEIGARYTHEESRQALEDAERVVAWVDGTWESLS